LCQVQAFEITVTSPDGICKEVNGEYYIVKGSTVNIELKGNPDETVGVTIKYKFKLTSEDGTYEFEEGGFPIPLKSDFIVKAYKVKDLNVKATLFIFSRTLSAQADKSGVATVRQSGVPAGCYGIKIWGTTDYEEVTIETTANSKVTLDGNGEMTIVYDTSKLPLGDYYRQILNEYGAFYPAKDSVTVSEKGEALLAKLAALNKYSKGKTLQVGDQKKTIAEAITIDGTKLVFADQSWLLIRPSGTEPKVRFYVESRGKSGTAALVEAAKAMLDEIGLI
jgi:hypothetical protein